MKVWGAASLFELFVGEFVGDTSGDTSGDGSSELMTQPPKRLALAVWKLCCMLGIDAGTVADKLSPPIPTESALLGLISSTLLFLLELFVGDSRGFGRSKALGMDSCD